PRLYSRGSWPAPTASAGSPSRCWWRLPSSASSATTTARPSCAHSPSAASSAPSSPSAPGGERRGRPVLGFSTERRKHRMRLALAQINSVVGDIDGNAARIVEWVGRARDEGADLVLFPELAVTGYPPEDLRPGFVRAARRAVDGIAKATHGLTALVGAPHFDSDLFNGCFVLAHGEVRA